MENQLGNSQIEDHLRLAPMFDMAQCFAKLVPLIGQSNSDIVPFIVALLITNPG